MTEQFEVRLAASIQLFVFPDSLDLPQSTMGSISPAPETSCSQFATRATETWSLITNSFRKESPHHVFWWQMIGLPLAILLEKAAYTPEAQQENLRLFYHAVVPELGPGPDLHGNPRHWKSFMTDHFCPVELSWEWNLRGGNPTIRFSFEPISLHAGSPIDPFNAYAALRFVRQNHSAIPACDLRWFDHFSARMLNFSYPATNSSEELNSESHQSRIFLALDLTESGVMLKAYFIPAFEAFESKRPVLSVIYEAIESLPTQLLSTTPSYQRLQWFLQNCPEGQKLRPEIVAIDCIIPEKSRIKIYMRSHCTSFEQVRKIMLLGDTSGQDVSHGAVHELRKLWKIVFGLQKESPLDQELGDVNHRTSGILYYFELRSGKAQPGVKVYLPVRHYGNSDLDTAERLQDYLGTLGKSELADDYIDALKSIM
jgi:DMATS type aromatic prenyltransferase